MAGAALVLRSIIAPTVISWRSAIKTFLFVDWFPVAFVRSACLSGCASSRKWPRKRVRGGWPIPGFTFAEATPFTGDVLGWTCRWQDRDELSALRGKTIEVAVKLRSAKVFAGRFVEAAPLFFPFDRPDFSPRTLVFPERQISSVDRAMTACPPTESDLLFCALGRRNARKLGTNWVSAGCFSPSAEP